MAQLNEEVSITTPAVARIWVRSAGEHRQSWMQTPPAVTPLLVRQFANVEADTIIYDADQCLGEARSVPVRVWKRASSATMPISAGEVTRVATRIGLAQPDGTSQGGSGHYQQVVTRGLMRAWYRRLAVQVMASDTIDNVTSLDVEASVTISSLPGRVSGGPSACPRGLTSHPGLQAGGPREGLDSPAALQQCLEGLTSHPSFRAGGPYEGLDNTRPSLRAGGPYEGLDNSRPSLRAGGPREGLDPDFPSSNAGGPERLTSHPDPRVGGPREGLDSDSPGPVPGGPPGSLEPSGMTEDEYTEMLRGLPIHGVTPAGVATGLIEAYLHEPGALGSLSRSHLRRSSGEVRSGRSRDLLPLPLPSHVRTAVLSRDDAIADATSSSNSRANRKWRHLGISLWSFLVICSLNFN